jgi:outer membrane translocation and assembly module TamA
MLGRSVLSFAFLLRSLQRARVCAGLLVVLAVSWLAGCQTRPPVVPGETDIRVEKVEITSAAPDHPLELEHEGLFERLGMRPKSLIRTPRTYSEFREAEDRRRIEAYWQTFGYFDVEVAPPDLEWSADKSSVKVNFKVKENTRYAIGEVHLEKPPPELEAELREMIPFSTGTKEIDLEAFRKVRSDMADELRRAGYGHANVYSRAYVDKDKKLVHWFYFVDAGPPTRIASIHVDGNHRVPSDVIIRRSGLVVGAPYKEGLRDSVVRDLLDTGAFAAAFVRVDTDTKFIVPGTAPDSGGELRDEQIDMDGNLVPRKLPEGVNITIHVVEAPRVTVRLRGSFEIDPSRADTALGATLWFRNLFAPLNHLVAEGRVGYGWIFADRFKNTAPSGIYGEALLRSIHNGVLGRLGDLRVTAHYKADLFPGFFLHRFEGGPGVRTTIAQGLFFDVDLFAVYSKAMHFGPFSDAERASLHVPTRDDAYGPELQASIVWDRRENPVEAMKGHLLAFRTRFAPGKPVSTHRYLDVAPEARVFIPLGKKLALGLKAQAAWVLLSTDAEGVPLMSRLFGGGQFGVRGYGREQLSPRLDRCQATPPYFQACDRTPVGGLSLVETSAELRFLPPRDPYGAVVFADFGGASATANPFHEGVALAAGLGLRLRLWYLPAGLDFAYAILRESRVQGIHDSPFQVFFRIGEAF